ncbi:sodium-dependent transporter [Abyssisolibacter fermentans]|uniref:sodium-dependent transporter n=1 Tax=Abyssisolibacter fermentans TaxID=1766203 RepID=UPI000837198E|nr:sodium-dependent transporter [Abyssisolibacter fermentans]
MSKRGQWGSRMGFILAAIGSAIGLGNIWRFPYVAASNGGGAFLIPYLFALLTAGIPILILEFSLGHKVRTSTPGIFGKIKRPFEALGWFQTMISFGIMVYYVAIIGWSMNYFVYAFTSKWGIETKDFFFNKFLQVSEGPFTLGGLNKVTLITLVLAWLINYIILRGGVKAGIEKANKIFMPLLIICLITVMVRGVTLEGAAQGLDYFFKPDFSKLLDLKVWIAAYGQIFYSLSICFGIMMTYSSYLPDDTDIVNNAFITGLGNCSFSIMSGIAVFSVLGYMAAQQGVSVSEVATGGIGLAFIVFPKAINALPGFNGIFGAIFFLCLIFAGLSSSMSIMEVVVSGTADKFNASRTKVLTIATVIGFVISLIFVSGAGIYILDIVDHFINTYCIAISGLIELLVLTWYFNIEGTRKYANKLSDFTVGTWWNKTLIYMTPILLSMMFLFNTYIDFTKGYEGYPIKALLVIGGGTVVIISIAALIIANINGSKEYQRMISEGVDI